MKLFALMWLGGMLHGFIAFAEVEIHEEDGLGVFESAIYALFWPIGLLWLIVKRAVWVSWEYAGKPLAKITVGLIDGLIRGWKERGN